MAKKKNKKPKKAKKGARKTAKRSAKKAPKKAAKKPAKKAAKAKASVAAPMLPGMAEGIETEEFEPEVGLVADDEEDEEVDFPETEEIVATPDLEKHVDDDEGEW